MSDTENKASVAAETQEPAAPVDPAIREMMDAGVFFGRTKAKTHPRVKQHIIANRNGIDIINLEKTQETLQAALAFVQERIARGAHAILVGTQPPANETLKKLGAEFSVPAVTLRWLGGTLTNYRIISQRLEYFKKLKSDLATNAFSGYTKKEQLDLQKEATKMAEVFSGLEAMAARPDLLIVVDPVFHKTAVAEANRLGIPTVALSNTDADPDHVEHSVLGNTKARTAIIWFLEQIAGAIRVGRRELESNKAAATAAAALKETAPQEAPKSDV
ncbi:MAG: 30S ribosomal protein S2 [Candidatus Liptonbacteria bacterium RIFCSPHIGHO2_01_FULL_57_28]|uniref:Small ribosomal subunit protein uS2 n=1 Tax=Candidatus Liptonbacteria bacterium RIFCSPHIGHO2_01_FULL_57_28 TaxID=1798647 RepID=A0A1G2CA73_9BACT|nr:MAG: 30S ribosomal protein S2 [Candidatus Liptonbacteria bacterium RIFCSPHIGHO2_01_FULL_57_28]